MHVIITHIYICPKTGCTARKMAFFITSQDRQTQLALAGDAMATTIILDSNAVYPRSLSPAKWVAASVSYYPSNSLTVKRYLGTSAHKYIVS